METTIKLALIGDSYQASHISLCNLWLLFRYWFISIAFSPVNVILVSLL